VFGNAMTGGSLRATAADSLASGNQAAGFDSESAGAVTTFIVTNSKAVNNQTGALAIGATIFLNSTTVSGNSGNGFQIIAGVINSDGNNAITDTTNSGSLTSVALR